ncbi:hypothetical protein ACNBDK_000543 [Escherichia coli]|nr:hypothetical protein [Escherichia coli]
MNQVAVVIGGGQTLGAFLCHGLAAEGYRVAVVDIQSDKVPLKRGCDYQDVLNMLLFYASPKASYCTGQSINITGGQVMF